MIQKLKLGVLALGAFAFVVAAGGTAGAQSKCAGEKIKAAGKKASCKTGLEAKQASKGGTIDPAKVAKCESKLSSTFAKNEAKGGCTTTGDAAAIEAKVDAFVVDLDSELAVGTLPSKCQGEKIKAAGKKAECKLGLESKQAAKGGTIDPAKVAKCESKLSSTFAKNEAKGGCNTTGDAAAIEAKVDAFVTDVDTEIPGPVATTTTIGGTTTTIGGTTTTTIPALCCPAAQIETETSAGTLVVGNLPTFPFPPGVLTTIEVGAGDAGCKHPAIVPAGGFSVPVFCIPALNYSSRVDSLGCEGGTADGNGSVWDGNALCPTPNVVRVGDTRDGVCDTSSGACNTASAGANTDGDIDTTRGGACLAAGVHTQLDIPVRSTTWENADPDGCPDPDNNLDGSDSLITQFDFILSPTTGLASSTFVDKNGDGCKRAGSGPDGPVTATGTPAAGPCCVVGQATSVVANGIAFTGAFPLFDIIFSNQSPATVSACNAPGAAQTCTLNTDPCQD